jgi:hypothetical protein
MAAISFIKFPTTNATNNALTGSSALYVAIKELGHFLLNLSIAYNTTLAKLFITF